MTPPVSSVVPKVSVAMITYNHEKYIAQAIESVLMQKTSFPVELVVGEDCSKDATRRIVQEYARNHSAKIRPLLHERNVGMHANFQSAITACRGLYIAILEGDDFWTANDKLQRQADFLDSHPDCPLCFHRARMLFQKDPSKSDEWPPARIRQGEYSAAELLTENPVPTCSVLLRRCQIPVLPRELCKLPMGDWPMWILMSLRGKVRYLDEPMAVYRCHEGGVWSSMTEVQQFAVVSEMLSRLASALPRRLQKAARALSRKSSRKAMRLTRLRELVASLSAEQRLAHCGGVARSLVADPGIVLWRPYASSLLKLALKVGLGPRILARVEGWARRRFSTPAPSTPAR
jgi:glycosyltransferase involved in cell wall biosynthesis